MALEWEAEHAVDEALARELLLEQFPFFAPLRLASLGAGWDNTAFLVNGHLVFRFPRRSIALPLLDREVRLLPALSDALPLPVPRPSYVGRPARGYPWPFAGYELLPGRTACVAALDRGARLAAAEPLGQFLAALHAFPAGEAERLGARPDEMSKLHVERRGARARERLARVRELGLLEDEAPLRRVLDDALGLEPSGAPVLAHGDLYARHLLVDERQRLAGVIDWGDLHLGAPAVDLAIAWSFLPPEGRAPFLGAYGRPVSDGEWRLARFRALDHTLVLGLYAADLEDRPLLAEVRAALGHVARGA